MQKTHRQILVSGCDCGNVCSHCIVFRDRDFVTGWEECWYKLIATHCDGNRGVHLDTGISRVPNNNQELKHNESVIKHSMKMNKVLFVSHNEQNTFWSKHLRIAKWRINMVHSYSVWCGSLVIKRSGHFDGSRVLLYVEVVRSRCDTSHFILQTSLQVRIRRHDSGDGVVDFHVLGYEGRVRPSQELWRLLISTDGDSDRHFIGLFHWGPLIRCSDAELK